MTRYRATDGDPPMVSGSSRDGLGAEVFQADVTNSESLRLAIEAAVTRWGRVDILHYNVGIALAGGDKEFGDLTDEVFDRVNAINLRGAVMAAKHVLPIMREQGSGVVINVASV